MRNLILFILILLSFDSYATKISARFVRSLPMSLEISQGLLPNHSTVNKFGNTINADAGIPTDVWTGSITTPTWVAPTQARIHDIVSTSASDDGSPVGVGARAIRIWGLINWDTKEVFEDLILNGLTDVPTVNAYVIIHRMKVIDSGTTSITVGSITATAQTDGTVTAIIGPDEGQSQMAIYGLPSVQDAYLTSYFAVAKSAGGAIKLIDIECLMNPFPDRQLPSFVKSHSGGITTTGGSFFEKQFNPYPKIEGPAIVKIKVISDQNDSEVSAGFDLIVVDK